jgi:hypothetical protein
MIAWLKQLQSLARVDPIALGGPRKTSGDDFSSSNRVAAAYDNV